MGSDYWKIQCTMNICIYRENYTSLESLEDPLHDGNWTNVGMHKLQFINPFTPKSDQCQTSPAASPVILHHIVWGTWLFIAYSDERWLYHKILTASPIHFSLGRLGECSFWAWDWKGSFDLYNGQKFVRGIQYMHAGARRFEPSLQNRNERSWIRQNKSHSLVLGSQWMEGFSDAAVVFTGKLRTCLRCCIFGYIVPSVAECGPAFQQPVVSPLRLAHD